MSQFKVCIILPALNEEETIGSVIDEIPGQALKDAGYVVQVLVVDNGSTDKTGRVAKARGAEVIVEPRKGKGRAVRTALETVDADFIFMLDADYTYPTTYIPDMLDILQHDYAVVIGSRLKGKRDKGAMNRLNTTGNQLLTLMANTLYRSKTSDLCTGLWGFKGEVIKGLKLSADGFDFEAELFTQVAKNGYRIGEVPIHYRRRHNEAKLNSLKDGLKIGWKLITERFC
jgi:dolichol-phosphate mannosyltransferase